MKSSETAAETVFNKNMDEIVYFFEETKHRVVFFEDLDRLEDPSIFIHLRELNTLLNNYDGIKGRIVFIYTINSYYGNRYHFHLAEETRREMEETD